MTDRGPQGPAADGATQLAWTGAEGVLATGAVGVLLVVSGAALVAARRRKALRTEA